MLFSAKKGSGPRTCNVIQTAEMDLGQDQAKPVIWSTFADDKITVKETGEKNTWIIEHCGAPGEIINVICSETVFSFRQKYWEAFVTHAPPDTRASFGLQNYLPQQGHELPGRRQTETVTQQCRCPCPVLFPAAEK